MLDCDPIATRGAVIVGDGLPYGSALGSSLRFGEKDLLACLVDRVRPAVGEIVLLPGVRPVTEIYWGKFLRDVTIATPSKDASISQVLSTALEALSPTIQSVALLRADLPYLTDAWLHDQFSAVLKNTENDVDARLKVPGVFSREAFEKMATAGHPPELAGQSSTGTGSMGTLPTSPVVDNPGYRDALTHMGFCQPEHPAVTMELYGNLQMKTGSRELPCRADTLGTLHQILLAVFPEVNRLLPQAEELSAYYRFSINGEVITVDLNHPLKDGDQVMLFSATVGG